MNAISPQTPATPDVVTPPPQVPMPNDQAARSATGEILEPAQIVAQQTTPPASSTPPSSPSEPTSTPPKDPAAPAPKDGVPETYEFKVPDGYTLDKAVTDAFTPIAKELGLSQDAAQKLVDFHTSQMIAAAKAPADSYEATRTQWKAQVDADPAIKAATADGKTGLEAVKIGIAKTLNALGDPQLTADFKAAMDLTGAGDNPAFIKAMWKLSSFITEGKHVAGNGPSPHGQTPPGQSSRPDAAHALYPNHR